MQAQGYDAQIPHFVATNPPTCGHKSPDLCAQIPRFVRRAPCTSKLVPQRQDFITPSSELTESPASTLNYCGIGE